MKTVQEIEALKHDWAIDPCWDLEETEGFEDHKKELLAYSNKMKTIWEDRQAKKESEEMKRMGLTNKSVYAQIKRLDSLIERLEQRIQELEDR